MTAPAHPGAQPRTLTPRRSLPNGRAVTGGLLVAVAAIGMFASTSRSAAGPSTSYVVATRTVAAGARLGRDDVTLEPASLPADTAARSFSSVDAVVGRVAVGPLAAGELVNRSGIVDAGATGDGPSSQVSFAIDDDRAVDGTIVAGDRVDVLATFGTGEEANTDRVVAGALVAAVSSGEADSLAGGTIVITLSLTDPSQVLDVVQAVRAAEVTVVRTTGSS